MRIIFLDIDGVLNTIGYRKRYEPYTGEYGPSRHFCHDSLRNLRKIIDVTNAKIVLTSTWRFSWRNEWRTSPPSFGGLDTFSFALYDNLSIAGVAAKVIGVTPDSSRGGTERKVRGAEIETWIKGHKRMSDRFNMCHIESIAILDDDSDMLSLLPYLIKTDPYEGISDHIRDITINQLVRGL